MLQNVVLFLSVVFVYFDLFMTSQLKLLVFSLFSDFGVLFLSLSYLRTSGGVSEPMDQTHLSFSGNTFQNKTSKV